MGIGGDNSCTAQEIARKVGLVDPWGVCRLMWMLRGPRASEHIPPAVQILADRAARELTLDDPRGIGRLLEALCAEGLQQQACALALRAARDMDLREPYAVAQLLRALQASGMQSAIQALLSRNPDQHVVLEDADPGSVGMLLTALRDNGAPAAAAELAQSAAEYMSTRSVWKTAQFLNALDGPTAQPVAALVARRALAVASADGQQLIDCLKGLLAEGFPQELAGVLAETAARNIDVRQTGAVAELVNALVKTGASDALQVLLKRNPADNASVDDPAAVRALLEALRRARAASALTALSDRAVQSISTENADDVAQLMTFFHETGDNEAMRALLDRDPARYVAIHHTRPVEALLRCLQQADQSAFEVLAHRVASEADVTAPLIVAARLGALHRAGAQDAIATLLARSPEQHVVLGDKSDVSVLMSVLHTVRATSSLAALGDRASNRGLFSSYIGAEDKGATRQYPHGRDTNGAPQPQWNWIDLPG